MQRLTFCGVDAHHQNDIAEANIKQLTLASRTILLHAQRLWPGYISTMLWPFALLAAANRINNMHVDINGLNWMLRCKMQGELGRPSGIPACV